MAVRGRAHDRLGGDIAAGARPVLDNERLTEAFRQPLADQPCNDVDVVAGGEADDDVHRPRRIGLRPGDPRDGRQRGSARGQMQKIPAGKFHFGPSFTSLDQLVGAGEERCGRLEAGAFAVVRSITSLPASGLFRWRNWLSRDRRWRRDE